MIVANRLSRTLSHLHLFCGFLARYHFVLASLRMVPTVKKTLIMVLLPMIAFAFRQPSQSRTHEYRNANYNFCISLPADWSGYRVIIGKTVGNNPQDDQVGRQRFTHIPFITIRHPQWTAEQPREDILIMVMTHEQWRLSKEGKLIFSATTSTPGEVGRNAKYVFAVPPRFAPDDLPGWREADKIVTGSFHAPCRR